MLFHAFDSQNGLVHVDIDMRSKREFIIKDKTQIFPDGFGK